MDCTPNTNAFDIDTVKKGSHLFEKVPVWPAGLLLCSYRLFYILTDVCPQQYSRIHTRNPNHLPQTG